MSQEPAQVLASAEAGAGFCGQGRGALEPVETREPMPVGTRRRAHSCEISCLLGRERVTTQAREGDHSSERTGPLGEYGGGVSEIVGSGGGDRGRGRTRSAGE